MLSILKREENREEKEGEEMHAEELLVMLHISVKERENNEQ